MSGTSSPAVLVGGVGELYQGDLDAGRVIANRLAEEDLGAHVLVEELHYGAVAVAQRLDELAPDSLVLVGAAARGRAPGTVVRRRVDPPSASAEEVQRAVAEAITGYVSLDLLLEVAAGLGSLPPRTVAIEVEPASTDLAPGLSAPVAARVGDAVALVRDEVRRAPLLALAGRLRERLAGARLAPSPAVPAIRRLLTELEYLDRDATWGDTFLLADVVRSRIAAGELGEGMDHLDWGLWWGLLEELERLGDEQEQEA